MNDFKLQVEKYEKQVDIDSQDNNVLIYSEYDKFDKHSLNLKEYLNKEGIKTKIIPSKTKKGFRSSCCDFLAENVLFFIGGAIASWPIGKYLDWLWKESKIIIKNNKHLFKKRDYFIVRCPISIYDKKNKKVNTTIYTGEIKDVTNRIESDFNIK